MPFECSFRVFSADISSNGSDGMLPMALSERSISTTSSREQKTLGAKPVMTKPNRGSEVQPGHARPPSAFLLRYSTPFASRLKLHPPQSIALPVGCAGVKSTPHSAADTRCAGCAARKHARTRDASDSIARRCFRRWRFQRGSISTAANSAGVSQVDPAVERRGQAAQGGG